MQFFKHGDLVQLKHDGRIGVIVESRPSNDGLSSIHMKHIQECYPDVYYVMFPNEFHCGPFSVTELSLKQCHNNRNKS